MSRIGLTMQGGDRVGRASSWCSRVCSLVALFEGTRIHPTCPRAPVLRRKVFVNRYGFMFPRANDALDCAAGIFSNSKIRARV